MRILTDPTTNTYAQVNEEDDGCFSETVTAPINKGELYGVSGSAKEGGKHMKVFLKPDDRIEALIELEVIGDGFKLVEISEAAEDRNFAIWIEDDENPDGGNWYEIHYDLKAKKYYYDDNPTYLCVRHAKRHCVSLPAAGTHVSPRKKADRLRDPPPLCERRLDAERKSVV